MRLQQCKIVISLFDFHKIVFLAVTILSGFIYQTASAGINNSFCSTTCINGSCSQQCFNTGPKSITGSGNLETRAMPLSGFTNVYVDNAEFSIVQGEQYQVDITADDNLFEYLNIHADNGVLIIDKKSGAYSNTTLKAMIQMPSLAKVTTDHGAQGTVQGFDLSMFNAELNGVDDRLTAQNNTLGNVSATLTGVSSTLDMMDSSLSSLSVNATGVSAVSTSVSATLDGSGGLSGTLAGTNAEVVYCGTPTFNTIAVSGANARVEEAANCPAPISSDPSTESPPNVGSTTDCVSRYLRNGKLRVACIAIPTIFNQIEIYRAEMINNNPFIPAFEIDPAKVKNARVVDSTNSCLGEYVQQTGYLRVPCVELPDGRSFEVEMQQRPGSLIFDITSAKE